MALMIGQPTKEKIKEMVGVLIGDHLDEINDAYIRSDGPLSISLSAKIQPGDGANHIEVGINFVASRCKDAIQDAVDENQLNMFGGGGIDSVTFERPATGEKVVLGKDEGAA